MTILCSSTPPDGQARVGRVASGGREAAQTQATREPRRLRNRRAQGYDCSQKSLTGSNTRQAASICERAIETGTLFPVVFLLLRPPGYRRTPFLFITERSCRQVGCDCCPRCRGVRLPEQLSAGLFR